MAYRQLCGPCHLILRLRLALVGPVVWGERDCTAWGGRSCCPSSTPSEAGRHLAPPPMAVLFSRAITWFIWGIFKCWGSEGGFAGLFSILLTGPLPRPIRGPFTATTTVVGESAGMPSSVTGWGTSHCWWLIALSCMASAIALSNAAFPRTLKI